LFELTSNNFSISVSGSPNCVLAIIDIWHLHLLTILTGVFILLLLLSNIIRMFDIEENEWTYN